MPDYATASCDYSQNAQKGGERHNRPLSLLSNTNASILRRKYLANSRLRWTEYMDGSKAIDLIEAADHAALIGLPLNQSLTLHFEKANLSPAWREQDALSRYLKIMGQWFRLRGVQMTFVWVMENSIGRGQYIGGNGMHAHVLVHCPSEYVKEFRRLAEGKWLTLCGMEPVAKAVVIKRIGNRQYDGINEPRHRQEAYRNALAGQLLYFMEGLDPESQKDLQGSSDERVALLMQRLVRDASLPIYGRRMSRSQNIGATARKRYRMEQIARAH